MQERLIALRAAMKEAGVGGFIVPRADEYQGEFVAPYAERLSWLTGFTGSAGVAVILENTALVMSDGRYTIQLAQQVNPAVYDTADSTKANLEDWLAEHATPHTVIGYDPRLHTPAHIKKLEDKGLSLKPVQNLIDKIRDERPALPNGKIEVFPAALAGRSHKEKIKLIQKELRDKGARACILTKPDSIGWLFNIRGSDVPCVPTVLSYAIIHAEGLRAQWIVDKERLDEEVLVHLGEAVDYIASADMESAIKALAAYGDEPVMLDFSRSAIWFKNILEASGAKLIDGEDPCILPKAIKTPEEQTAIRAAHALDCAALCKFLHWVDTQGAPGKAGEVEIADEIGHFRGEHPAYRGESFPAIVGWAANGAIVHYRATPEKFSYIDGSGLLLIDSGGQYLDGDSGIAGTTDITRTVAVGTPNEEMKERFTLALKGHIALATAKFPQGTTGAQIDTFARAPLWRHHLDYAHGTGHGVGCYGDVHEEAASISPRGTKPLQAGMLLSNEPGYYKAGEYGIRIENLILVVKAGVNTDTKGEVLGFETISFAPIDTRLIASELLDEEEKNWLNDYHRRVFDLAAPSLNDAQKEWLKERTLAL